MNELLIKSLLVLFKANGHSGLGGAIYLVQS